MKTLRIAARKSDLARIQVYEVARALREKIPGIQFDFQFSQSLGDKNLEDPLWKMPEKGVFTRDLQEKLIDGSCDLVVHSWKDLPLEGFDLTEVVATLERQDARDLLLFKNESLKKNAGQSATLKILSSSPRRGHNLPSLLKDILPIKTQQIQFLPVRGNVGTRIQKLLDGDCDGLIVAAAALNRLLKAPGDFEESLAASALTLREKISSCRWMLLPLKENPTAAAQGALAIEIKKDRKDLIEILEKINHRPTFKAVSDERKILGNFGGGCHQKLGISLQPHRFGTVLSVRGIDERNGKNLVNWEISGVGPQRPSGVIREDEIWPSKPEDSSFFKRKWHPCGKPSSIDAFLVSRTDALPQEWEAKDFDDKILWVSGAKTWTGLAARGFWINGSCEGLGEYKPQSPLFSKDLNWRKLTHGSPLPSTLDSEIEVLETYELIPKSPEESPKFLNRKYYFWMSATAFMRALQLDPRLLEAHHSCGPGNTYSLLKPVFDKKGMRLEIYLDFDHWRHSLLADPSSSI